MSVELVYKSIKGNNYYWTTESHFTRKKKNHYQWERITELTAILPKLVSDYPNLFTSKNIERFYVYDVDKDNYASIELASTTSDPQTKDSNYSCPIKLNNGKYYAIAIDTKEGRFFFSTSKSKFIKDLTDENIRRWKELDKASATANSIRLNKKIWNKYPGWNPLSNYVINLKTGKAVWPNEEFKNGFVPIEKNPDSVNSALILMLLAQLTEQLTIHFKAANSIPTIDNDNDQTIIPEIDLEQYNAQKVYEAFKYLTMALSQQVKVNQALKAYDNGILQDYLHTVEVTDIEQLDTIRFVRQLQKSRKARRQIKDLALLLNTISKNMNIEKILKSLGQNPSLKNQYHYRNHETGKILLTQLNKTE
ncbi:hypothetical protein [Limosilactobacillus fastidiosus]|uniref:Uncharacterized protein n=1 Tax=Limosilactobacillus fastidiosus TaxID=2759855 RepID=A0ABR6E8N9_9LACO|nr:hypothetical protein [Limosilactobacillus fastidiosus]MBB1063555.1 hypothetical protein [Limosilactobacillus fastidiosus]MCD7084013.1 hypothetical protein [Limosilactobacillus fastidiosus]